MHTTAKKSLLTFIFLLGLSVFFFSGQVSATSIEELYRQYNTIDTGSWNRLEDIKDALGNPTFEGNDGSHYYVYQPLTRALKVTDKVLINTEGYHHQYVPNRAIVLPGFRVTIHLNNSAIDHLKDAKDWQNFSDVKNALGDPSYIGRDGHGSYYVYDHLQYSFRVSSQLMVNSPGREGDNYVPSGDVVSKGQRATIRFRKADVGSGQQRRLTDNPSDDEIRSFARDRHLEITNEGGRVFTPSEDLYLDTNKIFFDTQWGRKYQGSHLPQGHRVTLWRR